MKKIIFPSFLIYKNMNSLILKINILTTELKCFPNHNLRSIFLENLKKIVYMHYALMVQNLFTRCDTFSRFSEF